MVHVNRDQIVAFKELIQFAYFNKIDTELEEETLVNILVLSDQFLMVKLLGKVSELLERKVENIWQCNYCFSRLAFYKNHPHISRLCQKFSARLVSEFENFENTWESSEFCEMDIESVKVILSSSELKAGSENPG